MIKWLICLFWSHDIDKSDFKNHTDYWENEVMDKYTMYWCKRCNRYKRV